MDNILVEHTKQHISNSLDYIKRVYPDAKQLDAYPILRNMRRWVHRLEQAINSPDRSPWIYDHLPECLPSDDFDQVKESKVVLIRTLPSMEHFTAHLRTWEDHDGMHREWVLEGRDGYTLSVGKVDCWMEIPS